MTTSEKMRMWWGSEGGSAFETVCGAVAAVLAVMGLAHVFERYTFPIAGMVLGAAFLVNGSMAIARYERLRTRIEGSPYVEFGPESAAGIAAIVLCLMALAGVDAPASMSAAVIVLAIGLSLGSSGVASRLSASRGNRDRDAKEGGAAESSASLSAASYLEAAVGAGALILGIAATTGSHPAMLDLVALLLMGIARCS